jgi:hypothetical protein
MNSSQYISKLTLSPPESDIYSEIPIPWQGNDIPLWIFKNHVLPLFEKLDSLTKAYSELVENFARSVKMNRMQSIELKAIMAQYESGYLRTRNENPKYGYKANEIAEALNITIRQLQRLRKNNPAYENAILKKSNNNWGIYPSQFERLKHGCLVQLSIICNKKRMIIKAT